MESSVARVKDPLAGSYYIEDITQKLVDGVEKGWT